MAAGRGTNHYTRLGAQPLLYKGRVDGYIEVDVPVEFRVDKIVDGVVQITATTPYTEQTPRAVGLVPGDTMIITIRTKVNLQRPG